jgi:uncharacterized protein (TIGR04255 family)
MPIQTEKRIPRRLKKEPLLEAVWELRFQSGTDTVENLLSGIIYDKMIGSFGTPVRLAAADMPLAARIHQSILNYTPMFRFDGKGEKAALSLQVAPRAITVNCRKPYLGWEKFKSEIMLLADVVWKTGLITAIERFSLKYIDLVPAAGPDYTTPLEGKLNLGGHNLGCSPLQLTSQLSEGDFVHVITLLAPARVQVGVTTAEGLLVDIDTILPAGSERFWDRFESLLDQAHGFNHALFFGILKPEIIEQLEPEFDLGGMPQ